MKRQPKAMPVISLGWYRHYAARFNKTGHPDAMYLAQLNLTFYVVAA